MIDYDATLQKFFQEILHFLNKQMQRAKDKHEVLRIANTADIVRAVAKNPGKYSDYNARVADGVEPQAEPFMPNPRDNSAYLILRKVLHHMGNLDNEYEWYRKEAQDILLKARRAIAYKNSKNLFRDIQFLFKSAEKFAVKKEIGR